MRADAPPTMSRRSVALAALSTIVEWYDFTLYLYFATILSRTFFGGGDAALGQTLASFALAYLLRPLGAIVFGHIGDRYGRRLTMLLSMAMMAAAMLATALLPTYAQIGPAAGGLLLGLRCVMAFSVGGEYTGVVAYLLEGAARERRGLITSLAAAASEVGGLLAVGLSAATVALLPQASLDAWGWRIPFFAGSALAAIILVARSTVEESPDFLRQKACGSLPANPLKHSLTHHRGAIARGFAISALGSITYYVGITYVPAFLTGVGAMAEGQALILSTIAAVAVIVVTPFVGWMSDRVGRKPVLMTLAAVAALLSAPMFAMLAQGGAAALVGVLLLAWLGGAVSAVGAVTTAELFPGEGRLSGLALGATSATAIFGGIAPWAAHGLVETTGWASAPGIMMAVVALCVLPVFWRLPETAPRLANKRTSVRAEPVEASFLHPRK